MSTSLDEQAIAAALAGRWQEAAALNQQIVAEDTKNVDALNRLAYALAKCGSYKDACDTYQKVLELDSYNPLALKNLSKYKQFHTDHHQKNNTNNPTIISPNLFLSDAEKTKTVNLLHIAPQDDLQDIAVGEEVYPLPKRFELHIKDKNSTYLGTLPDDIGHPLLKLLKQNSSSCRFFVKDIQTHSVTIFIKY